MRADVQRAAAGRARRAGAGSVVVLDVQHRRDRRACTRTRLRPAAARRPRHQGGPGYFDVPERRPGEARPAARVPRELPAGLDVQGRDDGGRRSTPASTAPDHLVPRVSRARPAPDRPTLSNFGGGTCGGTLDRELRASRATRRSARSASSSATSSRRAWRASASAATAAARHRARRRAERRPAGRELPGQPAAVRVRRHRPGRRRHDAAADGAGRGRGSPTAA